MDITQEILDAYVLNELNDSDKEALEQKIKSDKNLAHDIRIHKHIIRGLEAIGFATFKDTILDVEETLDQKGYFSDGFEKKIIKEIEIAGGQTLKDMLKNVESDLDEKSFFKQIKEEDEKVKKGRIVSFSFPKILSIAASVVIIVTAAWHFWPKPINSDELYEMHFAALSDDISDDIQAEMGEIGFAEGDNLELNTLKEAMQAYNDGEYSTFLTLTKNLSFQDNLSHYHIDILIYQAIAFMKMENFEDALATLESTDESDETRWYMSLIYLHYGEASKARELLLYLKEPPYSTKAQEILSVLGNN